MQLAIGAVIVNHLGDAAQDAGDHESGRHRKKPGRPLREGFARNNCSPRGHPSALGRGFLRGDGQEKNEDHKIAHRFPGPNLSHELWPVKKAFFAREQRG